MTTRWLGYDLGDFYLWETAFLQYLNFHVIENIIEFIKWTLSTKPGMERSVFHMVIDKTQAKKRCIFHDVATKSMW